MDSKQNKQEIYLKKEANLLSFGYCRDYSNKQNAFIPHEIQFIVFLFLGINTYKNTINRYGFVSKHVYSYSGKGHLIEIKKENDKLQTWMTILFPANIKNNQQKNSPTMNNDEKITKNWNRIKNNKNLKSLIRKGIPQSLRGIIWKNLCGSIEIKRIELTRYGSKTLYKDLVNHRKSPYHDNIWKDINRRYRKHIQFGGSRMDEILNSNEATVKYYKYKLQNTSKVLTPQDLIKQATPSQKSLYNICKAFSIYRKDIGYTCTLSAIIPLLTMIMTEQDAFWVIVSLELYDKYKMDELHKPHMPDIQLRFYQMERCVSQMLSKLNNHFIKHGITSCSMYQASQWFITTFLATNLCIQGIYRIWDIWLNEGYKTIFRFGIGYLKYFEKDLLKMDFEEMFEIFRNGYKSIDVEKYIKISLSIKITHKQLQQFEQDFRKQQRNR